jgi:hypothetical protein
MMDKRIATVETAALERLIERLTSFLARPVDFLDLVDTLPQASLQQGDLRLAAEIVLGHLFQVRKASSSVTCKASARRWPICTLRGRHRFAHLQDRGRRRNLDPAVPEPGFQ